MAPNVEFLQRVFSDFISQDFDASVQALRIEFDARYENRQRLGFSCGILNDRLEDEWRFRYVKLEKRRNWLWFLMRTSKFVELDEYFNTDFTFQDLNLRLNLQYERCYHLERDRFKYINRKHNYVEFSKSNLPVEENEYIADDNDQTEEEDTIKLHKFNRSKWRSFTSLVDNNKSKKKIHQHDNRNYQLLYEASLKLRKCIIALQRLRLPLITYSIKKSISAENIEMSDLRYQGGMSAPIVNTDNHKIKNLLRRSNKPTCCEYCHRVTCVVCWQGNLCCSHRKRTIRHSYPVGNNNQPLPGYAVPPRLNELELLTQQLLINKHYLTGEVKKRNDLTYQGNVEQDVGGDTNVVQLNKAHNVVLTETEITQQDTAAIPNPKWGELVSSDVISDMDTLVNRWFRIGTYVWTTLMSRNATIISLDLPRVAIFAGESTCEQPNRIPFRIHRYWRGDMIVKIHINCNKFQIGQLQCSWYYQPKADASFASKNNVYTRSGTHHCIISAAPNNEVELCIPFKAYKSMYHTKTYAGDLRDLPLDLGTLFITVLSPLKTTGETSPKCSFTVFVKFTNNEFTGMIAGNVDTPPVLNEPLTYQMEEALPLLLPLAEKLLVNSFNDANRDNPPLNKPPSFFVPTASHSWAIGTDLVEPIHNLRLSGRAQTKHPDRDVEEMTIDSLKRKYMICDIFSWSQQNNNGELLWSLPVNPIPPKDRIYVTSPASANTLASYQLTPIGFLSSLFQYWRGSIEYRFDIVASQFHSGKLLLAYIPGLEESGAVTIAQARASPHIVISLDNAMSYTWRVPYVADRPWWPRRYAGESVSNNVASPSKIFAFVLNELVMAETVPDSVEIIVYMRGGEDMEFAIPVQPSIGLGYDRNYISSRNTSNVYPVSTTDTFYVGNWHSTPIIQVLRHAPTSDAVGRFSEPILDRPVFYNLPNNWPRANFANNTTTLGAVRFYIFLKGIGFSEYIGVPIWANDAGVSLTRLEACARAAFQNEYTYGDWVNQFLITTPGTTTETGYGFIPSAYVTTSNTYGGGKAIPFIALEVSPTLEDLEYQGNREETLAMVDDTISLRTTGSGMLTYGEKFVDLKDLCRRYQIYGWTSVPAAQIERDPGSCSFLFPVLPQGLNLQINTPTSVNQIWNRAREGHIPLIASLYRFYRGSIRLRVVVSNGEGLIIWVQHRPDRKLERDVITPCTQVTTAEAVFNHTYGLYMQAIDVNNVVEFEVPFYQMANFGLLQQPQLNIVSTNQDWSNFYSIGEISVGFFGNQPTSDVRCTIYYSIADDCRFSTFQGVPPMVIVDDLPEYQGNFVTNWFAPKEFGREVAAAAVDEVSGSVDTMIKQFCETITAGMSDTYTSIKETVNQIDMASKLQSIASQFIHAINNPTATTIAISLISVLITLGLVTYSCFSVLQQYITVIWNYISNKVSSNKVQEEAESANEALSYQGLEPGVENAVSGFLSLICGGLCTLFGVKAKIQYKPLSACLFNEISNGMKVSNVCLVFFKNFVSVITDMKALVVAYAYPGFNAAESLMQGRDIIEQWVTYSNNLIDPRVAQNIKYNSELHCSLLDCYAFGKILKVKALDTQYPAVIQLINTTFDKLHKLYTELIAQGIDPHVRKLPFVIYNYGLPEIGKSHLTTDIVTELCRSEGITTETSLMCILNATSKFWDDCDRQPALIMDDAFNVRKGTMLEDQIAAIFNVVSPVVLVPPKAAVEDKGRTYNPEIFIMNSNESFFKTEVCREDALWRRRDILIKTELDTDFVKQGCLHCEKKLKVNSSLPKEVIPMLKDYHHLKFQYTFDVTNPNCSYLPENGFLKYNDLMILLKKLFKINREAENYKFAERVAKVNDVMSTRESIVGNVDNLEQLWNDAIVRRKIASDLIANSTLQSLSQTFSNNVLEKWADCKHTVFKKIYSVMKPTNNPYLLMNPSCSECLRIKYQCASCKMRLAAVMADSSSSAPSASSSSIEELLMQDEKMGYQSGEPVVTEPDDLTVQRVLFKHDVSYALNSNAKKWLESLNDIYPPHALEHFKRFLDEYSDSIAVRLRKYPKYARSVQLLKSICDSFCKCLHNSSTNMPFMYRGKFAFVNPASPGNPDIIDELSCNNTCWMALPWQFVDTIKVCKKINNNHEGWMGDVNVNDLPSQRINFNDIFSKMTQFVYDFYFNTMKPAAKAVMSFFTSIQGWVLGLSFLTMLFSTAILGVGCYDVMTSVNYDHSQRVNSIDIQRDIVANSVKSPTMMPIQYQTSKYDPGKARTVKAKKAAVRTPQRMSKDLQYQSAQQFDVIKQRLENNMSSIDVYYTDIDGRSKRVRNFGLMLRDQQMLIQRHYYDFWRSLDINAKFYFSNPNLKTENNSIPLPLLLDCDIDWYTTGSLEYIDSNFGVLHLPRIIPSYKDITRFIAKSTEHQYIKFDECYLFSSLNRDMKHCIMNVEFDKQVTDHNGWLRLSECYSYKYSGAGLCGSVLLASNLERPIIGIHFAGTSICGYSEPICVESFVDIEVKNYDYNMCDFRLAGEKPRIEFETLLYPQGTIETTYSHHQGSVSQYIPSGIHGAYDVDTEPNPLSPSDPRLPPGNPPLKKGVECMGKPPKDFENSLLNSAAEDLKNTILETISPIRVKIDKLSLQDAICGNKNVIGFEPLEWSSSEGFPLKALRPPGVKGKRWLFDLDETSDGYVLKGMHGELKRQLYVCDEMRKQGIRLPTLFTDCLKDTCISKEKCSIPGKTRIFSISPVQYTIAFKQYFGDFLASYQHGRIKSEHGIGINVDSMEWSEVANYITTYGSAIVAGDYKNFGPALMLKCVEKAFDIIIAWYSRYDNDPERQLVRKVLLSEILHAHHLCLNVVYTVPCGIPSGSPITTPLNSLVNSLYLRCAWRSITREAFSEMHAHIKILTYGDDVCINVSDKYKEIYNTETLNEFFKKYDIVFTDIDKSDNIVKYRSLDNVSFLKRGFKPHPNKSSIFLAPIEEQSIRKCVNWITRKGDSVQNTLENCKQACELAFGHGPQYYNRTREFLQQECIKRLGISFKSPSWYDKSDKCFGI